MKKYFDKNNNRLIFTGKVASDEFWDEHWKKENNKKAKSENLGNVLVPIGKLVFGEGLVLSTTKKHLPLGAKILEGGCGLGANVLALHRAGYNVVGVDYAEKTVRYLNKTYPDLDIQIGDVRKLPFPDNEFNGYWSLGVIEHFWEGYDEIAIEMSRVVGKGDYVFLTFPSMSWLRRLKTYFNFYEEWNGSSIFPSELDFYQFALDPKRVIQSFVDMGFSLISKKQISGIKGFKDEVLLVKPALQKLYDSKSKISLVMKKLLEPVLGFWAGHMTLFVLEKK